MFFANGKTIEKYPFMRFKYKSLQSMSRDRETGYIKIISKI